MVYLFNELISIQVSSFIRRARSCSKIQILDFTYDRVPVHMEITKKELDSDIILKEVIYDKY